MQGGRNWKCPHKLDFDVFPTVEALLFLYDVQYTILGFGEITYCHQNHA